MSDLGPKCKLCGERHWGMCWIDRPDAPSLEELETYRKHSAESILKNPQIQAFIRKHRRRKEKEPEQ